jgi:hypothetical protein
MNVLAIYCDEDKCIPKLYGSIRNSVYNSRDSMEDYSLLDNDIFDVMYNAVNMKKVPRRDTRKRMSSRGSNKKSKKKKRKYG